MVFLVGSPDKNDIREVATIAQFKVHRQVSLSLFRVWFAVEFVRDTNERQTARSVLESLREDRSYARLDHRSRVLDAADLRPSIDEQVGRIKTNPMSQRRCTARAMAWGEHIHSADGLQPAVAEQDSQTGTGKHLRHFPCTRIKRREQPFKGAATQGQPHTSAQWYDAERSYCYAKIQPHGWWGSWQVPPGKSLAGGHPAS